MRKSKHESAKPINYYWCLPFRFINALRNEIKVHTKKTKLQRIEHQVHLLPNCNCLAFCYLELFQRFLLGSQGKKLTLSNGKQKKNIISRTNSFKNIYLVTNTDEKQRLRQMSFSNLTFTQVFFGIGNPKQMQPDKSLEQKVIFDNNIESN